MRLVYLKGSLEISRREWSSDALAMWNVFGANNAQFPDGTTVTLDCIKAIGLLGVEGAAKCRACQNQEKI